MENKEYFVHETSFVDDGVKIGAGTKIWHFCHIQTGAVIGEKCSLGQNVNISKDVTIGNGVKIQNNVSVYEGVTLEDCVFCGPSCVLRMTSHRGRDIPREVPDIRRRSYITMQPSVQTRPSYAITT